MTTNTTVETKALTPEQKAARAKAAEENLKSLEPYMAEAKVIVAKRNGIQNPEAMDSLVKIKQIAFAVHRVAKDLKKAAEGTNKAPRSAAELGGTPKWIDKLKLQFQKAVGFAKKHKISDENLLKAFEFAIENPITVERKQPVVASETPAQG